MFFQFLITFIIFQRIIELYIAKKNETFMKKQGAIEVGKEHYKYIVSLHVFFFISLFIEVLYFEKALSQVWPILIGLLILTQLLRIWVLVTLGKYWNTKIIVLEGAKVKANGPFRFFKHPNYLVVCLEIFLIPMIFQAYVTLIVFSIANAFILFKVRIPAEEQALIRETNYSEVFIKPEKS
ncbi:isoprenylcysteine carboxyl methyltransferase [Lottiidibacillus patelloidae]|uniref:Isoprenylcysteine carboxyl methyltransferase n=1 Tax=Lottiidibacillus patelloidae TaxID=2670334 RepID=A0A263BUS2_9BACI|nr:isoprenylcysteine carboxylmethyltransferase family protein [Lottiidibacillus patelloidae]OZM57469.1 isoprenylcysteine carboxyl methyltransferase [Lottiidibacillus patelloidae]